MSSSSVSRPRIGLALGSGAARGWAHIGVIRTLERAGVVPDIVCGTSIGALVGAAYAAGELDRLEPWVQGLSWQSVLKMFDLKMSGGLIAGGKLVDFFRSRFQDQGIEALGKPFGCVATELASGREIWLREGSVVDAVRASIALPGLFTPVPYEGDWLVDGGLVNPVPVSLCRAMGADVVIAVDLNWQFSRWHAHAHAHAKRPRGRPPSMMDVLTGSLNIMQVRIAQSRLAGEPADLMIRPRLLSIQAMEFHRGKAAIEAGQHAAEHALPQLQEMLG